MSQISKCPKLRVVLGYWEALGEVSEMRYNNLLYSSSKRSYCSWNPPITYNSLNNIDFAMKRWMKPDWVIFQWKFSGFCKNPVDLVQLVGTFFLLCRLSDNRQAIDQCLIWNPITLQGEQTMSLVPANPSESIGAKQGSTSHSDSPNPLPGCKILRSVISRSCNL